VSATRLYLGEATDVATRTYLFGGLYVPGPSVDVARSMFDIVGKCVLPRGNHRLQRQYQQPRKQLQLDCCRLERAGLPFVKRINGTDLGVELEVLVAIGRPIHVTKLRGGVVFEHVVLQ
jgi:hypothetical protein